MTAAARPRRADSRPSPADGTQQITHVDVHLRELRMTIPVHGTLGENALESIFQELQAAEASGILHLERDGGEKRIYFRRGRIVSAVSDDEDDELGRALLAWGKLEPKDLDMALRAREKTGQPLAEVLNDLLLLPASEVERAASELERTNLFSVLTWPDGEFRFEETSVLEDAVPPRLDLAPSELVEREKPSPAEAVVHWASNPPTHFAEATLSTKESALLDFLRAPASQGLTASEILQKSPLSDEETIHVLSKLVTAGVLEMRDPNPAPEDFDATLAGSPHPSAGSVEPLPLPSLPRRLGRFEVERALGRGSMGAVLLAKDPAIDRTVAIKLIQTAGHLSTAQLEKYRERFYREASAAGQLVHPSIVTVYDVGHSEDGTPFIVMEYVKGETLRDLLERGPLDRSAALRIAGDVLEALSFAHSQGIVHRDVKPTNVIVTPELRAKIMDFGIAHVVGSELTSAEDVLGSPYYMAPEQLSKGPIGPRTDLFSFAVVLYRMLTGVLPFMGDSFAAIAHAILHEDPAPPERLEPTISKALSRVVLRCLEKSAGARYESAAEVLRALEAAGAIDQEPAARKAPLRGRTKREMALAAALVLTAAAALGVRAVFEPLPPPVTSAPAEPAPGPPIEPSVPDLDPPPGDQPDAPPKPEVRSPPRVRTGSAPKPVIEPQIPKRQPGSPLVSAEPAETPATAPEARSEADLYYQARILLERGWFEDSLQVLDRLLERNPTFVGAAELRQLVSDEIWKEGLPLVVAARHNHRLGSCQGELSLAAIGIRFHSADHDWAFAREDIRVLERPDPGTLFVETFEKDTLLLGKNKRYRFELETPLGDSDWARYQRILK